MRRLFKRVTALTILCVLAGTAPALGACLTPPGDLDGNGATNVVDVQCDILLTLWDLSDQPLAIAPPCLAVPIKQADLNCDKTNNVTDVLLAIQYALDVPLSATIDANGDQCPDTCSPVLPSGQVQLDTLQMTTVGGCMPVTLWLEEAGNPTGYSDTLTLSGANLEFYEDALCETSLFSTFDHEL